MRNVTLPRGVSTVLAVVMIVGMFLATSKHGDRVCKLGTR